MLTGFETQANIGEQLQEHFATKGEYRLAALVERMVIEYRLDFPNRNVKVFVVIPRRALFEYDGCTTYPMIRANIEKSLREAFEELIWQTDCLADCVLIDIDPDVVKDTGQIGLNNCFFKTESTIGHDELRFRSKAEIAIYEALCKRKLLFFPNAAAILSGKFREKREPDFLICSNGKWGILEVMGDPYHKNAAKDHDRARLFKEHGVRCMEFFTADDCKFSPDRVVDKFLSILASY